MAKSLVIVESPAKAATLEKFLGKDFTVMACYGHVRDLQKKGIAVDREHGYAPSYEILPGKERTVQDLKKAAKSAETIYLAADPDREGEAICWHLQEILKPNLPKTIFHRAEFHEITKAAVTHAVSHPGVIDQDRVNAQQARRIIDRLVGYEVSDLLWLKLWRGLSAGRVQTVTLRIIVERESERERFVPVPYFSVPVTLRKDETAFPARVVLWKGERLKFDGTDPRLASREQAEAARAHVEGAAISVVKVDAKERKGSSPPPFTTSKLQQGAAHIGFSVRRTMQIAQRLYEGKTIGESGTIGLITYMRTDSTRSAEEALVAVRDFIGRTYGPRALPEETRRFRQKKDAQDAHEAIRPTSLDLPPEAVARYLAPDELKLYRLIWNRFVASQMSPSVSEVTSVDIEAVKMGETAGLRAAGTVLKDPGWLRVYEKEAEPEAEEREKNRDRRRRWRWKRERQGAPPGPRSRRPVGARIGRGRGARDAAPAALQRGLPREVPRGERHRPAVDLRRDHAQDRGPRVREEERPPLHTHAARAPRRGSHSRGLRRLLPDRVHREDGRGAGRGRGGKARLAQGPRRVRRQVREGPRQGPQEDGLDQGGARARRGPQALRRFQADERPRRLVPEKRPSAEAPHGQGGPFHRMQRLSRMRLHAGHPRGRGRSDRRDRRRWPDLRRVRQPDEAPHREERLGVSRLHGVSRMPQHDPREGRGRQGGSEAGRPDRRGMPELRPRPRDAPRAVRRLHLVLELPRLPFQASEARDAHRREVPQMQGGRHPRAAGALRPVLRLLELSDVRQELPRAPRAEDVLELQGAVPSRAGPQGGPVLRLRDGRLRPRRAGKRSRPLHAHDAHPRGRARSRDRRGAHAGPREGREEARVETEGLGGAEDRENP